MRLLLAGLLTALTISAAPAPVKIALTRTGDDAVTRALFARLEAAVRAEPHFRLVAMSGRPALSVRVYEVARGAQGLRFRFNTYEPGHSRREVWDSACAPGHDQDCVDAFMQTIEDVADR